MRKSAWTEVAVSEVVDEGGGKGHTQSKDSSTREAGKPWLVRKTKPRARKAESMAAAAACWADRSAEEEPGGLRKGEKSTTGIALGVIFAGMIVEGQASSTWK